MIAIDSMKKPIKVKKRMVNVKKKTGLVDIDMRRIPHFCGIWPLVNIHAQTLAVDIRMRITELVIAVFKIDVITFEKLSFLVKTNPTIKV